MKTITFYSYKGGVGRSLALANIADRLSEFGKKVCLIDFDLEAPGLPFKFRKFSKKTVKNGIVDYIHEYSKNGVFPSDVTKYITRLNPRFDTTHAPIYMLAAGNVQSSSYWSTLNEIDWSKIFYTKHSRGVEFFLDLKEKIATQLKPDFLLIDSRTGISEVSGITTNILADEVVIMFANNDENLFGANIIVDSILSDSQVKKTPSLHLVLSRIPDMSATKNDFSEDSLIKGIVSKFLRNSLSVKRGIIDDSFFMKSLSVLHSDQDLEIQEELKIGIDKDLTISGLSRDYLRLFELLTNGALSDKEIEKFARIKKADRLYKMALSQKDKDLRIKQLLEAKRLNSEGLHIGIDLFGIYFDSRDLESASRELEELIKTHPNHPQVLIFQALLFAKKDKLYDQSLEITSSLIKKGLNMEFILGLHGSILLSARYFDKAEKHLRKSLKTYPNSAVLLNQMAVYYQRTGNLSEAKEFALSSIETNMDFSWAYCTLAEISHDQGRYKEFYINMELALRLNPALFTEMDDDDIMYYYNFKDDKRFVSLLSKYNVSFDLLFKNVQ